MKCSGGQRKDTYHAVALVLDGADEVREVVQRAADDALVLRHGGADARELELLHARRQRQLRRAQPCATHALTQLLLITSPRLASFHSIPTHTPYSYT